MSLTTFYGQFSHINTFTTAAQCPDLKKVCRVMMKKRTVTAGANSWDANWTTITQYVLQDGISDINYGIDDQDYVMGFTKIANVTLKFDNTNGKFNYRTDTNSYWYHSSTSYYQALSQIQIFFGFELPTGTTYYPTNPNMYGVISGDDIKYSNDGTVSMVILDHSYLLKGISLYDVFSFRKNSSATGRGVTDLVFKYINTNLSGVGLSAKSNSPRTDIAIGDLKSISTNLYDFLNDLALNTGSLLMKDRTGQLDLTYFGNTQSLLSLTNYFTNDTTTVYSLWNGNNFSTVLDGIKNVFSATTANFRWYHSYAGVTYTSNAPILDSSNKRVAVGTYFRSGYAATSSVIDSSNIGLAYNDAWLYVGYTNTMNPIQEHYFPSVLTSTARTMASFSTLTSNRSYTIELAYMVDKLNAGNASGNTGTVPPDIPDNFGNYGSSTDIGQKYFFQMGTLFTSGLDASEKQGLLFGLTRNGTFNTNLNNFYRGTNFSVDFPVAEKQLNYIAITNDYTNNLVSLYLNGSLLSQKSGTVSFLNNAMVLGGMSGGHYAMDWWFLSCRLSSHCRSADSIKTQADNFYGNYYVFSSSSSYDFYNYGKNNNIKELVDYDLGTTKIINKVNVFASGNDVYKCGLSIASAVTAGSITSSASGTTMQVYIGDNTYSTTISNVDDVAVFINSNIDNCRAEVVGTNVSIYNENSSASKDYIAFWPTNSLTATLFTSQNLSLYRKMVTRFPVNTTTNIKPYIEFDYALTTAQPENTFVNTASVYEFGEKFIVFQDKFKISKDVNQINSFGQSLLSAMSVQKIRMTIKARFCEGDLDLLDIVTINWQTDKAEKLNSSYKTWDNNAGAITWTSKDFYVVGITHSWAGDYSEYVLREV